MLICELCLCLNFFLPVNLTSCVYVNLLKKDDRVQHPKENTFGHDLEINKKKAHLLGLLSL